MAVARGGAVGLVAGAGRLPFELARGARAAGLRVVAVGYVGATDPALERDVDALSWLRVGQLQKTASALKAGGAARALFAGSFAKGATVRHARPDVALLKLWASLERRGDDQLLRALADWFGRQGVPIVAPCGLLDGCFANEGLLAGPRVADEELREARRGLALCRALGAHDVGQTVAVRDGMVLAVEAMEGTDACIARAGTILPRAVVVKALKPGQDVRFDLPTIGPLTIDAMAKAKARVLAVEAGTTLVVDREDLLRRAKRARVSVVGL